MAGGGIGWPSQRWSSPLALPLSRERNKGKILLFRRIDEEREIALESERVVEQWFQSSVAGVVAWGHPRDQDEPRSSFLIM